MSTQPSDLWARCLQAIEQKIQPQTFQTWFVRASCRHLNAEEATIEVPTCFFADWLQEHYTWLIQGTIEQETSWKPRLQFVVQQDPETPRGPMDFSSSHTTERVPTVTRTPDKPQTAEPIFPLNPRYRFEHFVMGESNEFSFTAARAVAESPGQTAFNPLVISSGVGLGKTHLLQAIGDHCVRNGTAQKVIYVTAENFISHYINSIRRNDTSDFVKTYRTADVLLVDDIQFFLQTEGSQREFFHTFNALHQNEKQIVLSSDCPPASLKGFEDRLISRFQSGLVTIIDTPDLETRIAILNRKAEERGFDLPPDVSRFLAEHIDSNIRELEGALTRLLAYSSLKGQFISVDLAERTMLERPRKPARSSLSIDRIQRETAAFFHVTVDLLVGATRKQEVASARHIGMYLCKSLTGAPLKAIGTHFGNRDHTTVIHACRSVKRKLADDPGFEDLITQLRDQIQNYQMA